MGPELLRRHRSSFGGRWYINFMSADDEDRAPANYGATYDRLVEVKRNFDPDNLFHMNQNIKP